MKAVLLLHGFVTSYHDFDVIMDDLEKEYDHIERISFPGHGDEPDYKLFNVDGTFDVLINTFDELKKNYEIIDVIGFSMGGALATYLSQVRNFNKMVLLAPANSYLHFSLLINRQLFFFKSLKSKFSKEESTKYEEKYRNVRTNDYRSIQMALKELIPNYNYHTLTTFVRIISKCNEELREIKNPTLIIWGKFDQLVPKKAIDNVAKICTNNNVKVKIYEDLSHLMLRSVNSQEIIDEIIEFLKD